MGAGIAFQGCQETRTRRDDSKEISCCTLEARSTMQAKLMFEASMKIQAK
jgi:hypothetical protein